jgi:hypothetical protein
MLVNAAEGNRIHGRLLKMRNCNDSSQTGSHEGSMIEAQDAKEPNWIVKVLRFAM